MCERPRAQLPVCSKFLPGWEKRAASAVSQTPGEIWGRSPAEPLADLRAHEVRLLLEAHEVLAGGLVGHSVALGVRPDGVGRPGVFHGVLEQRQLAVRELAGLAAREVPPWAAAGSRRPMPPGRGLRNRLS